MKLNITIALVAFCIGLASALFLLPFWVSPFLAAVKKGTPSDWIGFAGSFANGTMVLMTGAAALAAAGIAVRPVYAQLREMTRQSDFASLAVLRKRAEDLNADGMLVARVVEVATLISGNMDLLITKGDIGALNQVDIATGELEKAVEAFHANAGNIWGSEEVQKQRIAFANAAFRAAENIASVRKNDLGEVLAFRRNREKWASLAAAMLEKATKLIVSIEENRKIAGRELAETESRILRA
jgi:hypothetical protein